MANIEDRVIEIKRINDTWYTFSGVMTLYGGSYNDDFVLKNLTEQVEALDIEDDVEKQNVLYSAMFFYIDRRAEDMVIEKFKGGKSLRIMREVLGSIYIFTVALTNYTGEYNLQELQEEYEAIDKPEGLTKADIQALNVTMQQLDVADRLVTTKIELIRKND